MSRFINLEEGALTLNTSTGSIRVTASNYRKKNGHYPVWYSSDGKAGARESYIDVEYLLKIHKEEMRMYNENCKAYDFMVDVMGIKRDIGIARLIAEKSELFTSAQSWRSYIQVWLFGKPTVRFHENVTRLKEFNRIAKLIKDEYESHNDLHAS